MVPPGAAASAGELELGAELLLPAPPGCPCSGRHGLHEEGRGGRRRAELTQIRHCVMASTVPRPIAVEGARPPSMEGVEERRSPRGGTAEACPSTTAQAAPPSRAGPPHPAPRVRPPPGRAEPSRAAGVEGEGSPEWKARGSGGMREGDEMRANADEYGG